MLPKSLLPGILALLSLSWCGDAQAVQFDVLHAFCAPGCPDGAQVNEVVRDSSGNLFGTTSLGGTDNGGTVFELSPQGGSWQFKTVRSFCANHCEEGTDPYIVLPDKSGNIFGATVSGGSSLTNAGVFFELSPGDGGWTYKVLYEFTFNFEPRFLTYDGAAQGLPYDGTSPVYAVGSDSSGDEVFTLAPGSGGQWAAATIYHFCSGQFCRGGEFAQGILMVDPNRIYGITQEGGIGCKNWGCGTVFELKHHKTGWKERVLYDFNCDGECADGMWPVGTIALDDNGNLYGTTEYGGIAGEGTLFALHVRGAKSKESILYSFCQLSRCQDGSRPLGGVVLAPTGMLYGTTYQGGNGNEGSVFAFSSSRPKILHSFCVTGGAQCTVDGNNPMSPLVLDPAGNLFGATPYYGPEGSGTAFEITP